MSKVMNKTVLSPECSPGMSGHWRCKITGLPGSLLSGGHYGRQCDGFQVRTGMFKFLCQLCDFNQLIASNPLHFPCLENENGENSTF